MDRSSAPLLCVAPRHELGHLAPVRGSGWWGVPVESNFAASVMARQIGIRPRVDRGSIWAPTSRLAMSRVAAERPSPGSVRLQA